MDIDGLNREFSAPAKTAKEFPFVSTCNFGADNNLIVLLHDVIDCDGQVGKGGRELLENVFRPFRAAGWPGGAGISPHCGRRILSSSAGSLVLKASYSHRRA